MDFLWFSGSYQGGAPPSVYTSAPSGYHQHSTVHVVSPPTPSVIVIGGCPACQVSDRLLTHNSLPFACVVFMYHLVEFSQYQPEKKNHTGIMKNIDSVQVFHSNNVLLFDIITSSSCGSSRFQVT